MPEKAWNNATVRELEKASIRGFMERNEHFLYGRVLDFGCGDKPYRPLVDGEYFGFDTRPALSDVADPAAGAPYDAVLCNQVLQYVEDPSSLLSSLRRLIEAGGYLVMTYATNWDEVEPSDLWRFTKTGMEKLLKAAGFQVLIHERRAEIELGGFKFPLGYGVVAEAV